MGAAAGDYEVYPSTSAQSSAKVDGNGAFSSDKLAAFLKWGGKSLVKLIDVSGKVANAIAAHFVRERHPLVLRCADTAENATCDVRPC